MNQHPRVASPSLPVVIVSGLALLLAACGKAGSTSAPAGFPPAEVAVMTVEAKTVPVSYEYVGQISGFRNVEVRARVTGILEKRNFEEGAAVTSGQSLFTIDPAPFRAALLAAEADVASSEARLGQAQRNVARLKPLYEAKAVSQKEYDDAVSTEQIGVADAKAARAKLVQARLNLDYTRVASPINGIASRALKSEGSLVSGPDVLLTTVSQIDPSYVIFGIPDTDQLRLRRETEAGRLTLPKDGRFDVSVAFSDGSRYPAQGKLSFADVRINNATGTSEARATLPNPAGALRPGQFVRVRLEGAQHPGAILLPQRAVLENPQGKFVYVVNKEGKAESRPVEAGDWIGDSWVINKGVGIGDRVIVDGVMRIGPGAPVKIAEASAAQPSAAPAAAPAPATKK